MPRASRDPELEPPFTFAFAALLTVLTSLVYALVVRTVAGSPEALPFAYGIGVLLAFGNAFAIALRRFPQPLRPALGLWPAPPAAWLAPFLLAPALLLISEIDNVVVALYPAVVTPVPEVDPSAAAVAVTAIDLALRFAVLVLIEPIATEAFFRGFLHGRLAALWNGPRAVFATSLLSWAFSVLSVRLLLLDAPISLARLTVHTFAPALLLGIVRHSSSSLYPVLQLAALFAAGRFLGELRALRIPGFDDGSAPHTPATWLFPSLLLTAAGLWLCYRLANRERTEREA